MTHTCQAQEQPVQPTLTIRTRTPVDALPQIVGQAFGAVAQYLAELGETPAGPPFAAYHNMDMQDLDAEFGFPVSRPLAGRGEIQPGEIPGGLVASCLHSSRSRCGGG